MTRETGTFSPWPDLLEPMRTSMSGAGHAGGRGDGGAGDRAAVAGGEHESGAISVPVHRKDEPKVISATDGYAPGPASWPPTMASEGAAVRASDEHAVAAAIRSLRRRVMGAATQPGPDPCGSAAA